MWVVLCHRPICCFWPSYWHHLLIRGCLQNQHSAQTTHFVGAFDKHTQWVCLQKQHSVPSESTFCALRINILVWHPSLGRKSVYYNHHRHNHHYLWCLVVVSPLFCALFTGNMTVFAKCLTLAYSFMKNSPFWMMMIIIITLVIVMMLIICISSTFSLKVHLKSHHNHYNQDYPHHNMYWGGRPIWPPPTPLTQRLDFEHFFMKMMIFIINKTITIAIIMKFTIFIITQW